MKETSFSVDRDKCIACGKCIKVCAGGILSFDEAGNVQMAEFPEYG